MPSKRKQKSTAGASKNLVFLSYSHKDRPWVSEFAESLREAGVKTWFDAHDILPGERWADRVQQALRESKTLIVILSPSSVDSPWTFFEIGAAVADDKRIIPVFIKDVEPDRLPLLLSRIQYLKEPSASEAGRRVAEALKGVSSATA